MGNGGGCMVLYHSPGLKEVLVKNINLCIKKVTEMYIHVGWGKNICKVKVVRLTENLFKMTIFTENYFKKADFDKKSSILSKKIKIFDENLHKMKILWPK